MKDEDHDPTSTDPLKLLTNVVSSQHPTAPCKSHFKIPVDRSTRKGHRQRRLMPLAPYSPTGQFLVRKDALSLLSPGVGIIICIGESKPQVGRRRWRYETRFDQADSQAPCATAEAIVAMYLCTAVKSGAANLQIIFSFKLFYFLYIMTLPRSGGQILHPKRLTCYYYMLTVFGLEMIMLCVSSPLVSFSVSIYILVQPT